MSLPTELFTALVDENFLCIICHGVFDDPASLKCGHTFCRECIDLALVNARRCPTCRQKVAKKGDQLIPTRVLKGLIENLMVRCKNSVCRDPDSGPDRQRRRLNNNEASATDDGCTWIGKLVDWPSHSRSECALETVSCTVDGCNVRCSRRGMVQHTANSTLDHLKLMVTTETQTLRNEFDNKIEALNKEHDSQLGQLVGRVQMLEKERDGLQETPHVQLSFFCRKWMERKPDALFDFVVYRKKSGLTTRLLCGIPGPKRTHWEGGLFPVLMTWFSDPDLPPMCEYPRNFHHVNVSPSGKIYSRELETWHRDISIPELLFSFQRQLAHPNLDSPSHEPAFRCYENNLDEYNEKTKELAEEYIREDFLRIASEDFILEPEEWILVNDMLGGGGMGVGVGIQVPTAHSPPAEPAIESRNTMGCSCSCCAWASSFWDGRREMLFLPVM